MRRKGFLPGLTPIRRKFSVSDESRVSEGGNFLLINNFHLATGKFPPRKTSKIERRRCVFESDLLRLLLWSELSLRKSACVLQMEQEISPLIPIAIRLLCHEFFTLTIRKWSCGVLVWEKSRRFGKGRKRPMRRLKRNLNRPRSWVKKRREGLNRSPKGFRGWRKMKKRKFHPLVFLKSSHHWLTAAIFKRSPILYHRI